MTLGLLIIYFFGLYIRPQDWVSFFLGAPLDKIIFLVLSLAFISNYDRYRYIFSLPLFKLLLLWVGCITISNLIHFEFDMLIEMSIYYVKFVVVFACIVVFIETEKQFLIIVSVIIILSSIIAIQCVDMVATGVGWAGQPLGWDGGWGGRAKWVGLWDGMNVLSLLFVTACPFLIQFIFGKWNIPTKILSALSFGLIFYAIKLTQSRGGFIALIVVILLGVKSKIKLRYFIIIGILLVPLLLKLGSGRMSEMDDKHNSAGHRVEVWSDGLGMVKSAPLFGVGKGMFKRHASIWLIAHNSFIENAAETGMIGFTIFSLMFYISLVSLLKLILETTDPHIKSIATALLHSVLAYAVTSLFVTTDFDLLYVIFALTTNFCYRHRVIRKISKNDFVVVGGLNILFLLVVQIFVIKFLN